jgi:putative hemolysin
MPTKEINIEQIIRSRAGAKAKYIPSFVFRWLERLIHQEFINVYIRKNRVGVDFCVGAMEYLNVKLNVEGLDNVPLNDGRPLIFVCNHPLGGIDGIALGAIIGQATGGRVKYIVNDLLMNLEGLAPLCIPINKFGKQGRNLPMQVDSAFSSDSHVLLFPAGLCSRLIDGKIHDIPWRKFFVNKSRQSQRDVVPVHFYAQNSQRFYRVAHWCERLHIKVNLAQVLLPDEMYRQRGNSYTIRFGKPIPYTTFDTSKTPNQWAEWVEDKVYEL